MAENVGNEIRNGFNAMANGVKEAGRKRINDLVAKQGYVAYRNLDAVQLFKNNPEYADWECKIIDGEYRFYPPINKQSATNEIDFLNPYKTVKADESVSTCISIKMLDGNPNKCEYKLMIVDKKTGQQHLVQNEVVDFNGKFVMEVLPSLYFQLCNGFPVVDNEKEKSINFITVDGKHMMLIGNLNSEQIKLIKEMSSYVDEKLHFNVNSKFCFFLSQIRIISAKILSFMYLAKYLAKKSTLLHDFRHQLPSISEKRGGNEVITPPTTLQKQQGRRGW